MTEQCRGSPRPSKWSLYRRAQKQTADDLHDVMHNSTVVELSSDNVDDIAHSRIHTADTCDNAVEFNQDTSAIALEYGEEDHVSYSSPDTYMSDSESDSPSFNNDDVPPLTQQLAHWTMEFNIPHLALNKLLHILKPHFSSLPADSRTLLQTPRHTVMKACGDGAYVHFGLESGIQRALEGSNVGDVHEVYLQMNVDGLPLFKSSNTQFWPILGMMKQPPITGPFVIGLFGGKGKPPVNFLFDFVSELRQLMNHGIVVGMNRVSVKLHSFVCDAPARAFVKCTKSHSGYSSCEKCDHPGEWCGKVIFSPTVGALRTDKHFRDRTDEGHHLPDVISPLLSLDMGMVTQFPLDPMHLLYLGVTRRLLLSWIRGPLTVRLPSRDCTKVSSLLLRLCPHIAREFCRRPRSLSEIDRWKATEFRFFLLYAGPIVMRPVLKDVLYKHFLLLFVACTILSSTHLNGQFNSYASDLLQAFVQGVADLYGKTEIVYNIHGLLHLSADAEKYGCLENFSSFPFENKLKAIKRLVRKPSLPLQQVASRLTEYESCQFHDRLTSNQLRFTEEHCHGPIAEGIEIANLKQFRKLAVNGLCICVGKRDGCVRLNDRSIVVIKNILKVSGGAVIVYSVFDIVEEFFTYPLPSSCLGIVRVSSLETEVRFTDVSNIAHKCIALPDALDDCDFVAFPMLHQC